MEYPSAIPVFFKAIIMNNHQEQRIVEIRAGEGGADARLFVMDLAATYHRLAARAG